jgi:hypothetical protein
MSFSLIVPAAANKEIYDEQIPPIFRLSERGLANCIEAVLNINSGQFTGIYFTILRQHDEKYGIASMLRMQLDRLSLHRAQIVILNNPTLSQAETIYQTICQEHISGPIFIKDADSMFSADIFPQNGIVVYPLEKLTQVNPQHKSYVAVDDMQYITNTIEKRVIDHFFNAGGYCFEDAHIFCKYYERYAGQRGLYLSHIVYAMLLDKHIFRPFMASNYRDLELI